MYYKILLPLVLVSAPASAIDGLLGACEVSTSSYTARAISASAALVPASRVTENVDGTYALSTTAYTSNPSELLCPETIFFGEPTFLQGRSGFLIGPDLVMTSPHSGGFNPLDFVVIFDLALPDSMNPGCGQSNLLSIPASDVYFPTTGFLVNTNGSSGGKHDFGYFRVDRPVSGRQPLRVRRSGEPTIGDPLLSAGHMQRLLTKVSTDGEYLGVAPAEVAIPPIHVGEYLFGGINITDGSSGSFIYNLNDHVVETTASWGPAGVQWTRDTVRNCMYLESDHRTSTTNGKIVSVSENFPGRELRVTPQDRIIHVADIGETLTQAQTEYVVSPGVIMDTTSLEIETPSGFLPNGSPALIGDSPDGVYTVNLPVPYVLTASIANVTSCGIWNLEANIQDLTRDWPNKLRHTFEIGLTETSISPDAPWITGGITAPYLQNFVYEISNLRPTPVDIKVTSDSPWLVMSNPGSETPGSTTLALKLSAFQEKDIILSLSPSAVANLTPIATHHATLSVEHQDEECAINLLETRDVHFTPGVEKFSRTQLGSIPAPTVNPLGAPFEFTLDLSHLSGLEIGDVDAEFGFFPDAYNLSNLVQHLKIEIESPDAHVETVWNLNSIPTSAYVVREEAYHPEGTIDFDFLKLDQSLTPPLGGGSLTGFNGRDLGGVWKFRIYGDTSFPSAVLSTHLRLKLGSIGNITP